MLSILAENAALRAVLLAVVFALVAALGYTAVQALGARHLTRRRLVEAGAGTGAPAQLAGSLRSDRTESNWLKLVQAIEKAGLNLGDSKEDAVRRKLAAAGFTAPHAPRVYTLVRMAMVIGLPLLVLGLYWFSGSSPSLMRLYFTVMITSLLGLYLPTVFIRARADRRQREILNAFPDALDLMLVCVEAGLGLEAAFARVGMELTTSHPLLAEQIGMVVLELRAGRSREDALRRMADRAGTDEIRAFATLLIQSTKLGSSVSQTLRTYAAEMRERRRMRAEEKAHRLPVLISIPLVACMLPVMIGVLMLPAAIRVVRSVLPAMSGGGG
jgi:tight adherence protein C